MKIVLRIVGGLVIALYAHALAFAMAGAGHGWIAPFHVSFFLYVAYPVTLVRLRVDGAPGWIGPEACALLAGLVADIVLIEMTLREISAAVFPIPRFDQIFWIWTALWCGWQIALIGRIAFQLRERRREALGTRLL